MSDGPTDRPIEKSPGDTASELKTMVQDYAVQEVKDPLTALAKWVGFGLAGALFVGIGVGYLTFGLLRLLQAEVGAFDDGLTFVNYFLAVGFLLLVIGMAGWGMMRSFDDE